MTSAGYIVLSILVLGLAVFAFTSAIKSDNNSKKEFNKRITVALGGFIAWFAFLTTLSVNEILFDLSPPPRFPLLILVPLIIIFTIFYFRNRDKAWINYIPKSWPICFQSFRIFVELLIASTVVEDILPESASYHGYNFDIAMGISAPFVAYFIYRPRIRRTFAIIWNYLGIMMILFVGVIVASSIYFPQTWGAEESLVSLEFLTMPYLLLPAFLAPAGIFLHIFSLMQLRASK